MKVGSEVEVGIEVGSGHFRLVDSICQHNKKSTSRNFCVGISNDWSRVVGSTFTPSENPR